MNKPFDPSTLNIIDPSLKGGIWDPNSEFRRELEIQRIKADTNYKVKRPNIMDAQVGMFQDTLKEVEKPKIFIPNSKGGFV